MEQQPSDCGHIHTPGEKWLEDITGYMNVLVSTISQYSDTTAKLVLPGRQATVTSITHVVVTMMTAMMELAVQHPEWLYALREQAMLTGVDDVERIALVKEAVAKGLTEPPPLEDSMTMYEATLWLVASLPNWLPVPRQEEVEIGG